MFKRVLKRKRRQEKEEELGLDSEMKEVLGMQDTDSEESDSSSDEGSSDSEAEAQGSDEESGLDEEAEEDEEDDPEDEVDETESVAEEISDDEPQLPQMSVTDAVSEPLYLVSLDSEVKACILCPGKLLKNATMSEVHKSSKAHNRRFARFVELVGQNGPEADIRDLIRTINEEHGTAPKTTEAATSKRAAKRRAKTAALNAKREKSKKIAARRRKRAKASKAGVEGASEREGGGRSDHSKKRRKVEEHVADETREDASEESPAKKAPRRPKFRKDASPKFQERPRTNAKGPRGKNGAARTLKRKSGQKERPST